jgi:predicted DNA-binding transcriptional regulator AlpA
MATEISKPARRLINRKMVEQITGLKNASMQRAIDRGELPQAVVFGDNTPRWWEDEVYAHLERLRRGKGRMRNNRRKPIEAESVIESVS